MRSATTANPAQHAARLVGLKDSTAAAAAEAGVVAEAAAAVKRDASAAVQMASLGSLDCACAGGEVSGRDGTAPLAGQPVGEGGGAGGCEGSEVSVGEDGCKDGSEGGRPWWGADYEGMDEELVLITQVS